jgi:hypothetical protein
MTTAVDDFVEDQSQYDFVDGDNISAASGNEANLAEGRLKREDSSRTMFTFATTEESKSTSPPEPPGTHPDRNQSEPPGRYLGRIGRRTTSPGRRRSNSPLPFPRYQSSLSSLANIRTWRSSGRLSQTGGGDLVETKEAKGSSNEPNTTKRRSIDSFLEASLPVPSEESSPTKPAAPNPVALLITDAIRKCDPSGHQMDDDYDRDPSALQLFPSKLRQDGCSANPRARKQAEGESPALDSSSSGPCRTTHRAEPLLDAIRTMKATNREEGRQVDTGASDSSSTTPRTPNPVAALISEALGKVEASSAHDPGENGKSKSSHLLKARRESRSRKKKQNDPAPISDAKIANNPRLVDSFAKSQSGPVDFSGGRLLHDTEDELESPQTSPCTLKDVDAPSELQRPGKSKARSRSETSERRRDSSPTKRSKSRTMDDLTDRAMRSSSEMHGDASGKNRQKLNSPVGRQDSSTTKAPNTKDSLDGLLSESPHRPFKRRNSTGSVEIPDVPVSSSFHRAGSRHTRPQTRSPPRARSPAKATSSSRESKRVASSSREGAASSLRDRADRSSRDRRAASSSRERVISPSRERMASPSRERVATPSRERVATSSRDCVATPSRERPRRDEKSAMQAMHMSLSSLTRNSRRSSRHRIKSDDKNSAKSMHVSLSCLFERSSPPRSRSNSRSLRVTRSTSFDLDKSPTRRSSSHRRNELLSPIKSPCKISSEAKTNGLDSKGRGSRSKSPSARESKSRLTPSASRLQRNKERSSSLKVPKTAPTRPRRSVPNIQNFPTLSLEGDTDGDDSINLEQLGASSHTTSLQLDISNPCLVETMLVASLLPSDTDSNSELCDNDLFKATGLRNKQSTYPLAAKSTSIPDRSSRSKTKNSLMSSLRDLSPRRIRVDRNVDGGATSGAPPQPWFPQLETLF